MFKDNKESNHIYCDEFLLNACYVSDSLLSARE